MVVIVSLGRAEYGERDGNGDTGQQNQRATERARRALTLGALHPVTFRFALVTATAQSQGKA